MKHLVLICLMFVSLTNKAQEGDIVLPGGHIITSNGAIISTSFNINNNMLNVDIKNNCAELEIVVVANGSVVESQISDFEYDAIDVDLSTHKNAQIDVYVRNREEEYYIGNMNKTK